LQEDTTRGRAKQAQLNSDKEVRDFIIVSSETIQATKECKHPTSTSTFEAGPERSRGDSQNKHQVSSTNPDTAEMAHKALQALHSIEFVAEEQNVIHSNELPQDITPPDIAPTSAALSTPSCYKESRSSKALPSTTTLAHSKQDQDNTTLLSTLNTKQTTSQPAFQMIGSSSQSIAATQTASHLEGPKSNNRHQSHRIAHQNQTTIFHHILTVCVSSRHSVVTC
jgi:hypothetical protein